MIDLVGNFLFREPEWALILLSLPLMAWLKRRSRESHPSFLFPTLSLVCKSTNLKSRRRIWIPSVLRILGFTFLVLALCRPQIDRSTRTILSSGVDIMVAVDLSASMLALDMSPKDGPETTRLDVVKEVLEGFIEKRKDDRIGLVAFSVDPYLVSPLTLDQEYLLRNLDRLKVGLTGETGTNIGSALAEGINRLRRLESKSKVLILLTDGKDEPPPIHSPLIFADGAKSDGIKVYTIAVGTNSRTRTFLFDPQTRDLARNLRGDPVIRVADYPVDESLLKKIADKTNGKFYQAKDKESLQSIYDEIDGLEKSEVEIAINAFFEELYLWPLAFGVLLLLTHFLLTRTIYLQIP